MKKVINFDSNDIQYINKNAFEHITLASMNDDEVFYLCDKIEDSMITPSFESECFVLKIDEDTFQIQLTQIERRKYWDAPLGVDIYMNWKKNLIYEMQNQGMTIYLNDYDDDGDYVHLNYYIDVKVKTGKEVIDHLTRTIDINLNDTIQIKIDKLMDFESKLTNRTII